MDFETNAVDTFYISYSLIYSGLFITAKNDANDNFPKNITF